ncbi:MAG: 23S rRNA (uracil(1939)-C(5))-methyltransferase RlmD [Chloroherpetonaceae bacterium]|nr:23S rRNA (uracil(1939)-C(5))-methyltransferase RlmD [Chloroherpetonaceae bacterium]
MSDEKAQPNPYKKGDRVIVTLSDVAEGDKLFARMPDGISAFLSRRVSDAPLAIGDEVEAEIIKIKKSYLELFFQRLIKPSELRSDPKCEHFGACGGCKWQHVKYDEQVKLKEKKVRDALIHIGGFETPPFEEPISAPLIFGYRNKIEFSFCDKRFTLPNEIEEGRKSLDFALGFHAPERYDKVIDINRCEIASDDMSRVLEIVKSYAMNSGLKPYSTKDHTGFWRHLAMRKAFHTGEVMVNLVTSEYLPEVLEPLAKLLVQSLGQNLASVVCNVTTAKSNVSFGESEYLLHGKPFITEKLGNYHFRISANSFFQTNTLGAELLYGVAEEFAEISGRETVFDFYSGTGSISIFISARCKKVIGVELIESSVNDAKANAERNGVSNAEFFRWDMKDVRDVLKTIQITPDVIITDPPRAGMHPNAVKSMIELGSQRIVYVSCNPSSLARDGKLLAESGYKLEKVRAVDLFPHTNHIESVALFRKSNEN